jgi:cbb3-type cytochrome oxidase subunit 3
MKIAFLSFVLSIFFIALTYYFYTYESPFRKEKLNELITAQKIEPDEQELLDQEINFVLEHGLVLEYLSTNAYIAIISLILSLVCFFLAVQLVIDKLFFKTLIEPPDYKLGLRRSVLLMLSLLFFFYLKFQGMDIPFILVPFPIVIIIEYLIGSYLKEINLKKELDKSNRNA